MYHFDGLLSAGCGVNLNLERCQMSAGYRKINFIVIHNQHLCIRCNKVKIIDNIFTHINRCGIHRFLWNHKKYFCSFTFFTGYLDASVHHLHKSSYNRKLKPTSFNRQVFLKDFLSSEGFEQMLHLFFTKSKSGITNRKEKIDLVTVFQKIYIDTKENTTFFCEANRMVNDSHHDLF